MPDGAEEGIRKGMYLLAARKGARPQKAARDRRRRESSRVQLLGSGTILREVDGGGRAARARLRRRRRRLERAPASTSCAATAWRPSAGTGCTRPTSRGLSYVETCLAGRRGPVVAATDYVRAVADQIRPWVRRPLRRPRHRRLRPQRHPRGAARLLRGRPPPRRGRGAQGAGRRGRAARRDGAARRSASTASTRRAPDAVDASEPRHGPMAVEQVKVPDIGDVDEVDVVEVLVAAGDEVEVDDSLITLESDKASMEVPSPLAGTVAEVQVKAGDQVGEGDLILTLEVSDEKPAAEAPPEPAKSEPAKATAAESEPVKEEPAAAEEPAPRRRRAVGGSRRPGRPTRRQAPARPRRHGLRQPGGAPLRPRAGRRPGPGPGHRPQGADPAGRRPGVRQEDPLASRRPERRPLLPEMPVIDFSQLRRDRARGADPDAEDLGAQPAAQLAQRAARHPARRGRHHRARGVPPGAQGRGQGSGAST